MGWWRFGRGGMIIHGILGVDIPRILVAMGMENGVCVLAGFERTMVEMGKLLLLLSSLEVPQVRASIPVKSVCRPFHDRRGNGL